MFQRAKQSLRRATIRTVVVVGAIEVTTHLPSQGKSSELYHHLSDEWGTPLLRRLLNPEHAHHLALEVAQRGLAPTYRPSSKEQRIDVSTTLWGKHIPNCIGLAAGFDKDAVAIPALFQMGFGLLEIGSVTLEPQPGNPSPRMFRLVADQAIINRYGFNSLGANAVEENLKEYRQGKKQEKNEEDGKPSILELLQHYLTSFAAAATSSATFDGLLGINLGKNANSTTQLQDYQTLIRQLGSYADYLVINVSCPNVDMKDLGKSTSSMDELLVACQNERDQLDTDIPVPILVKLSPDLTDDELKDICNVLLKIHIDGIILTNTTATRPDRLLSPNRVEKGGLSGKPLQQRSTDCIRKVYQWTHGSLPIIGVGGIFTGKDAYDKLRAGASLVQVYSGMVYRGPGMVSKIRHELAEIMVYNGHRSLEDVVGLDHDELFWKLRGQRLKGEPTVVIDKMEEEKE
jgi:dihydroorotate dehydrogenase